MLREESFNNENVFKKDIINENKILRIIRRKVTNVFTLEFRSKQNLNLKPCNYKVAMATHH